MCRLRIPKALLSSDELKDIFLCSPSKETKTHWQIDNITPAQINIWLLSDPDTTGVKISRRYSEYFPEFATF